MTDRQIDRQTDARGKNNMSPNSVKMVGSRGRGGGGGGETLLCDVCTVLIFKWLYHKS